MIEFKEITIDDRLWIVKLLEKSNYMACEYNFANNLAWRRLSDLKISRYKDFYIVAAHADTDPKFCFPSGDGDIKAVINEMKEYSCKNFNRNLSLISVPESALNILKELYGDEISIEKSENSFDYIYSSNSLANLAGKKFHSKRNHLKKFYNYNWEYSKLEEKDFDDCIELSVLAYKDKGGIDNPSAVSEQFAIHTFFSHYKELNLVGGVIRISDKVVAFTFGSRLNSNTFDTHVEKADINYQGSYIAINNEFAKNELQGYEFINREEDLGIEGLRKSKKSLNPVFLLEKYNVNFK